MTWTFLDSDREFYERELASFVPPRIFDAHAHLYENAHFREAPVALCAEGPSSAGWEAYHAYIQQITPSEEISGLFFGYPQADTDIEANNRFVAQEIQRNPGSRAQMLVTPAMTPEFIRETVRTMGFVGMKCYHCYASERPTSEAPIPSYLPEEQVRVAHEEGLSITLHMVRRRALADPVNQEVLRHWGEKYPNARFILAHAARGFNPFHTIEGIEALRGLKNMWCDTSAITECGAFEAIVRTLGVERLLYGSDFPVTHLRGRCVAIGDSFLWLSPENTDFQTEYASVQPTLVGLESLRALKLACMNLQLSDSQIEAIFYGNAADLFSLPS